MWGCAVGEEETRELMLGRIRATRTDDPDEDQPTDYALALAEVLVSEADPLPKGSPAPWGDGSIFVYWRNGPRQVHLFVPPNETRQPYMYHAEGKDHGVDRGVTPARVAGWLRWYCGAPGYAPNAAHLSDGRGFVDIQGLTEAQP